MTYRLGILCSHPIQYYSPIFRELAKHLDLQVFYAYQQTMSGQAEAGFSVPFEWDIDLLQGYQYKFLNNVASKPDPSKFFGCDTPGIVSEIKKEQFDAFLVLGWGLKSFWQAIRACRKLQIPVIVRGDSRLGTTRSLLKRALKRFFYPLLMRQFDACLYVGEESKKYYQAYGVDPKKCFFSPHSVDNERFGNESEKISKSEAKKILGLDIDKKHVLFVGKFIDIKRPVDVLQAALNLKQKQQPISIIFAGDGPLRSNLEIFAKTHHLDLHILGFINQSELPNIYRAADVLVLPSETETWGLVANEAMACGVPIIVSDTTGCSVDLAVAGKTGKVFPIGNIEALANAIHEMLVADLFHDEIKYHVDGYSPVKTAEGIISALKWLVGREEGTMDRHGDTVK